MTTNELFFAALVVLNVLDIHTTLKILKQGGEELNPVMSWLMGKTGVVPALLITKAAFLAAVWIYLASIPGAAMLGVCCLYVLIVLHNSGEIRK